MINDDLSWLVIAKGIDIKILLLVLPPYNETTRASPCKVRRGGELARFPQLR